MEFVITALILVAFCAVAYKMWYVPRKAQRGGSRPAEPADKDRV